MQYQSALAITGTRQGCSRTKLYEELGWETLSDRRMSRRILQIHKIIDKKTSVYYLLTADLSCQEFFEIYNVEELDVQIVSS